MKAWRVVRASARVDHKRGTREHFSARFLTFCRNSRAQVSKFTLQLNVCTSSPPGNQLNEAECDYKGIPLFVPFSHGEATVPAP